MSKKIVATDLQEERDKCNFNQSELFSIFMPDKEINEEMKYFEDDRDSDPKLRLHHRYYEMTVEEKQMAWFKKMNHLYFKSPKNKQMYFTNNTRANFFWPTAHQG